MALYTINGDGSLQPLDQDYMPHKTEYNAWKRNLARADPEAYDGIYTHLHQKVIGEEEIITSSWIPGSEWENTVYWPIYQHACPGNIEQSGQFFGLILWHVMSQHSEDWAFGHYKLNDIPIRGLTYFRIQIPS